MYAQVALSTGEEMKGLHEGGDMLEQDEDTGRQEGSREEGAREKGAIHTRPWMGEHGGCVKDLQGSKRWVCPSKGADSSRKIGTPAGM